MKSWKTTLSGILLATGTAMQASADATVKAIGLILAGAAALLLGLSAKDNNVTGGTKPQ